MRDRDRRAARALAMHLHHASAMSRAILVGILALAACATAPAEDATPSEAELAELDDWATTADGKSDLPQTWAELVASV